ncbi:MAG: tRNA pseudouridine(38-40) synthase TruA [Chitinispirillales bacterium]|jgi:tRNA pseudouridine38-40 synthase|nr:tRNA pseudouridine(38-40) synthase TruA [Chitinispirillales bacterium]
MRYFCRLEYDGTRFGGWQYQPNCTGVQQILEETLAVVLRLPCPVTAAGRTDAGVHARGQGVHFDAADEIDTASVMVSLNGLLPPDIAVYGLKAVRDDFHARYSAVSRIYKYYFSEKKSPLLFKRVWPVYYRIDWSRVEHEMKSLIGVHDFTAVCSSGSDSDNKECRISNVSLSCQENGIKVFTIEANRFIYKMVRSLVGTLVDIGRGRISDSMESIIFSKDRNRAGETAPACGLTLEWVSYPLGDSL